MRSIDITISGKSQAKDTGKGIDPEIVPKLFTKFATKSEKGTGLGLYICKGIIEAHGGKIWARNNSVEKNIGSSGSGSGATFGFSLPLDKYEILAVSIFDSFHCKDSIFSSALKFVYCPNFEALSIIISQNMGKFLSMTSIIMILKFQRDTSLDILGNMDNNKRANYV